MSVETKTTHVVDAKARLLETLRGVPEIEGLLAAFAGRTQSEETIAQQLRTLRWLSQATGVQLDGLGEIVGEPRQGKTDDDYRSYIAIRIIVNKSSGTVDELTTIANLVLGTETAAIEPYYPASMVIRTETPTTTAMAQILAGIISSARAAGVRATVEYSEVALAETLTFASGDSAEHSASQGFAGGPEEDGNALAIAVAVDGSDGKISTSADGETWVLQRTVSHELRAVAVDGDGNAVAVGDLRGGGGGAECSYSSDGGLTWTAANTLAIFSSWYAVHWFAGAGLWIGCGYSNVASGASLSTSPDMSAWTGRSLPANAESLRGLASNDAVVVAVGDTDGSDAFVLYSSDGMTWAEAGNAKSADLLAVCCNNAKFVAVGESDGVDSYIVTSTDGQIWSEQSAPKNVTLRGVCWSDRLQLFVCVGDADTDSFVATSPDGITWTERSTPSTGDLRAVSPGVNHALVACGDDGVSTTGLILTSDDGVAWTIRDAPGDWDFYGCAASPPGGAWSGCEEA